jgi:hypothetical protein
MSGGGIIIQRAQVLVTAASDSSLYDGLPPREKAKVDAIKAKEPASRDEQDLEELVKVLKVAIHC